MNALLIKTFCYLFKRNRTAAGEPKNTCTVEETLDFALLCEREQEAVKQYFAATVHLMQLVNGIRQRQRAVDVETILTDFRLAERNFVFAGMRPIFPPGVQCLSNLDPAKLISTGLLARFGQTERVMIYSPAMDRYVAKLIAQYHPRELDSTSFNPLS
jgi:hypothetical protein